MPRGRLLSNLLYVVIVESPDNTCTGKVTERRDVPAGAYLFGEPELWKDPLQQF
jgi:hypothetical protein